MKRALSSVTLAVLLFSSLTACTVTGPEVRIKPPIHIDVEIADSHHHHRHHHHHDD